MNVMRFQVKDKYAPRWPAGIYQDMLLFWFLSSHGARDLLLFNIQ